MSPQGVRFVTLKILDIKASHELWILQPLGHVFIWKTHDASQASIAHFVFFSLARTKSFPYFAIKGVVWLNLSTIRHPPCETSRALSTIYDDDHDLCLDATLIRMWHHILTRSVTRFILLETFTNQPSMNARVMPHFTGKLDKGISFFSK